jgi:hypothetical protein
MITISCKISERLNGLLTAEARKQRVSKSEIVRRALETALKPRRGKTAPCAIDLVKDLVGCIKGPRDMSTNPKYLEGFGE